MNVQKFTQKSLEALQYAQDTATEYQNNAIEPEHLTYALLSQENGLIGQLLQKMNTDVQTLIGAVIQIISSLPKVTGSGRQNGAVYISNEADRILVDSEKQAKSMKDEYVSVEHIFLSLLENPTSKLKETFRAFSINKDKFDGS
jgi:ATP-dependent Clp protease ATP-binding subunit ClpB